MINQEFYNHLCILLALMVGFTCFKIANCKPFNENGEQFDLWKLLKGTCKHLIVIAGTTLVFAVSCNCGADLMLIQMGETKITLQSAIDITTLTILAVYGVKYVKHLAEYAGVVKQMPEPETKEILPDFNISTDDVDEEGHA